MNARSANPKWRGTCIAGLEGAIARVSGAINDGDEPVVPVSEALHWIYCVYDHDRKVAGQSHESFLPMFLGVVADRDIARALAAIRGDQVHDFMEVVKDTALFPSDHLYPGEDLLIGRLWRWRDREPAKVSVDVAEIFRTKVAQMPVLETLERALASLVRP